MPDGIALRFGFTAYSAADERMLAQVLDHPAGPTSGRKGLRPGAGAEVTVGGSPATVTVQPFSAVLLDAAGGGTYHVVVPNPVVLPLPTAPAAGSSRIHEVAVRILNSDERSTDGAREVDVYIAEGAAAASPTAPTVPSTHLRLRRLVQPSSGETSVVDVSQRTVAAGGVLPVRSQAERDAIAPVWNGLIVYREDLGYHQVRENGAWTNGWHIDPTPPPAGCHLRRTAGQNIPRTTFTAISWDTQLRDVGAMFEPTSPNITITTAGDYDLHLLFSLFNYNDGRLHLRVMKNGANAGALYRGTAIVPGTSELGVFTGHKRLLDLAVGDVLSIEALQDVGANRATGTGVDACELVVQRVV